MGIWKFLNIHLIAMNCDAPVKPSSKSQYIVCLSEQPDRDLAVDSTSIFAKSWRWK